MSDSRNLLRDTAEEVFARIANEPFAAGWSTIVEAGLPGLLVPESRGGFGGDWGDAAAALRLAGARALPLPLGECMVTAWAIAAAGLEVPDASLSIASRLEGDIAAGRFTGTARAVPWGRDVDHIVGFADGRLLILPRDRARVTTGANPAGEPRDTLQFDGAPVTEVASAADAWSLGAFVRVAQAAGAMSAALTLAVEHVNGRTQFGKPLAKLQAVQQSLAIAAGEVAAADAAAAGLADAHDRGDAQWETAAAKLRINAAIAAVTSIAHQVHGAIGFTQEYPLHRLTRRLMGWRSEFGNDRHWSQRLGMFAAGVGGAGLWAEITNRTDR